MYVVPKELPESCYRCPFAALKYQVPFWGGDKEKANTKAYTCQATDEHKEIVMHINDETTKPDWCPLRECRKSR